MELPLSFGEGLLELGHVLPVEDLGDVGQVFLHDGVVLMVLEGSPDLHGVCAVAVQLFVEVERADGLLGFGGGGFVVFGERADASAGQ